MGGGGGGGGVGLPLSLSRSENPLRSGPQFPTTGGGRGYNPAEEASVY